MFCVFKRKIRSKKKRGRRRLIKKFFSLTNLSNLNFWFSSSSHMKRKINFYQPLATEWLNLAKKSKIYSKDFKQQKKLYKHSLFIRRRLIVRKKRRFTNLKKKRRVVF